MTALKRLGLVRPKLKERRLMSVTAGAEALGVTRVTLSKLINGQSGISPEMAVRLAKAFGSSAETWLGMQIDYDLAKVRNKGNVTVRRVARAR
jgi:antitoxin HigA-1